MHILCATDGSEGALAGARFLARLPLEENCHLTLLTVVPDEDDSAGSTALLPARDLLGTSISSLHVEVRRGEPAEEILTAAGSRPTDLIVVGSRGLSGVSRFFLGSVSDRVVRHAPCSVLLARPLLHYLHNVVLGTDGSAHAAHAGGWLGKFPLREKSEVHLVTVLREQGGPVLPDDAIRPVVQAEYERVAFALVGKRAVLHFESGDPAGTLLHVAERERADLLVVGSHGRTGIERFLLGSVSEKVVRHAPCSVLVVR